MDTLRDCVAFAVHDAKVAITKVDAEFAAKAQVAPSKGASAGALLLHYQQNEPADAMVTAKAIRRKLGRELKAAKGNLHAAEQHLKGLSAAVAYLNDAGDLGRVPPELRASCVTLAFVLCMPSN